MAAMAEGDLEAVVALLHPDVTLTGDANGKAPTAINVIRGADKVTRFLFGLAQRYGPAMFTSYQLGMVNGELGAYTAGCPATDGYREMMPRIMAITVRRRKGLRAMGCRQPRQIHRLPAARLTRYSGLGVWELARVAVPRRPRWQPRRTGRPYPRS